MKGKTETVVLILLIVLLAAYIALQRTDRRQYEIPEMAILKPGEITRLVVRRGGDGGGEVSLERDGQRWLIRPGDYPAEGSQVEAMLDVLARLVLTAVASEAGHDALYELDPDRRIDVEVFQGGRSVRRVWIGKAAPTGRHTFVKLVGDDPRIYHAQENFRSRFDRNAEQLRDPQVMKIEEEVSELVLTEGPLSLVLVKGGPAGQGEGSVPAHEEAETPVAPDPADVRWRRVDGRPVKTQEIDALLRTLANLKCAGYPPATARESLGEPSFRASMKGATGTEYSFSLYGKEDGKFLCTSSQSDHVFYLPEWQVKRIRVDLQDLDTSEGAGGGEAKDGV